MTSDSLWQPCEMCGDYLCSAHDQHAYDCDCPTIDDLVFYGIYPYEPGSLQKYIEAGRPVMDIED